MSAAADERHLLFVGQAVLDQVFEVERFDAGGGKSVARDHRSRPGGLAAQAARAAQRLRRPGRSPRVRLASAVGDDAAGEQLHRALADDGLDVAALARVAGARSAVSAVLVDAAGERQIHNFRGDALARAPLPDPALLAGCVGVLADPRWPAAAAWALAEARARGLPALLDGELAPTEVLRALLPQATWGVFSRSGLAAWAGADAAAGSPAAALALAARAAPQAELVVTLGADGALWRRPDGREQALPAFVVPVRDTNGAGDVLHGALLLALAEGLAPEAALRRAMGAAALACSGTLPDAAELDRFLESR